MPKYFSHESAYIDENVTIGDNTKLWHFSHVLSNTIIGSNCSFGQKCVVGPKVSIGNGSKVHNNVSIYEGVEAEDDVFLGPSIVFINVVNSRSFIIRREEFKKTLLKKGCSIGEYALIGSGEVINKNVPDYALMVGVPAKQIDWISKAVNTLVFDKNNIAIDEFDNYKYKIVDNKLEVL